MVTPGKALAAGLARIVAGWERITRPTRETVEALWASRHDRNSLWPLAAFRLSISRQAAELGAWMAGDGDGATARQSPERLTLYREQGRLLQRILDDRGMPADAPPERGGRWRSPAYRVELSQAGRLASGAVSSLTAAPGALDRFVEQIRTGRERGLYQAEAFRHSRELLRQSADSG